jgi:transposase
MRRIVGCDVHSTSCTLVSLSSTGRTLGRDVVETSQTALVRYVKGLRGQVQLCLEEGELAQWLVEILTPHTEDIVVIRGDRRLGNKNDQLDAAGLAELVRTGKSLRRVYKDPHRYRRLRELSRLYRMLSNDVVRVKNRIKGFYRGRGLRHTGDAVYRERGRKDRLGQVSPETRSVLEVLYRQLDTLTALKAETEKALIHASHQHPIAKILETAPGLGPVRVAQLLPIVATPHRFRTSRQFWAYCGFAIETRSTSDWVQENGRWVRSRIQQTRGLNFYHNRILKHIFKSAAITICRPRSRYSLYESYGQLLEKGVKPNLARLTIARKIAAIFLAMWKQQQPYDPTPQHP